MTVEAILEVIASGAMVIFFTQQIKRFLATTTWLPLIAVGLGVAIQLINDLALSGEPLTAASLWGSVVAGFVTGAAAAGTYDLAGRASAVIPPAEIVLEQDIPAEIDFGEPLTGEDSEARRAEGGAVELQVVDLDPKDDDGFENDQR